MSQQNDRNNQQSSKPAGFNPIGLCMGLGVGLCFGTAMGNLALGLCMGMGVGLCFSVALGQSGKPKE